MTTAVANPSIYDPGDLSLKKFLGYSIGFHAALALAIAVSAYLQYHGNTWGGVGGDLGGAKVNLVSSAGIPMPKEATVTDSQVVDPTKGIYKEEPPKPPEPKTDATKLPAFNKEKPLPPTHKSKTFESKTPPPENAVPYGKGGNPDLPTGYSQTPGGTSGVSIQGQGGGNYPFPYGWYIDAVKRKISQNWQQSTIDSRILAAHSAHAVVGFTINRDGSIKNVHLIQSSGNSSMDNSGLRALYSADHMDRLPSDYSGSYVDVTFDFDLALAR